MEVNVPGAREETIVKFLLLGEVLAIEHDIA
jgi:hypothetical protein